MSPRPRPPPAASCSADLDTASAIATTSRSPSDPPPPAPRRSRLSTSNTDGVTVNRVRSSTAGIHSSERAAGDSRQWIARLRARSSGFPPIEERTRFTVTPSVLDVEDAKIEAQAAGDHWEIVAWWRSRTPYRGSASTTLPGVAGAEEISVSTAISCAFMARCPWARSRCGWVGARRGKRRAGSGELMVEVPALSTGGVLEPYPDAPAGTPMPRAVNWRGIGDRDLFMESPPVGEAYGVVKWLTLQVRDMAPLERASSAGLFTGIPVDAADADGDGLGELVVFRLDGGSVWGSGSMERVPDSPRAHAPRRLQRAGAIRFARTAGACGCWSCRGVACGSSRRRTGYELAGEADGSGRALKLPGEVADIDGDGAPEAVFADEWGDLVVFRVGASSVETTCHPGDGAPAKRQVPEDHRHRARGAAGGVAGGLRRGRGSGVRSRGRAGVAAGMAGGRFRGTEPCGRRRVEHGTGKCNFSA